MAKRPATTKAARNVEDVPPAMDYAAHNATYGGFMTLLKWTIAAVGVTMVALYFFIEGQQPLVGTVLLLLIPIGAAAAVVLNSLRN